MLKINLTDTQEEQIGKAVVKLLNLKKSKEPGQHERYNTSIGTKTELGLGRVLLGLIKDIEAGDVTSWLDKE